MAKVGNFEVLVGCDPEFWVKKKGTEKLISAHGLVAGTKKNPLPLDKGAVQVDGMALEFNIQPVKTVKGFNGNINKVFDGLYKLLPDYDFVFDPVAEFGAEYIASQPDEAKVLGCEPDYNAYTKAINPPPNANAPFRTAAGHIHISWKKEGDANWPDEINPTDATHFDACCLLTKTLDAYLGIPSLIWDRNSKRRELYGKAGAFRPKCYGGGWLGMEYRVVSNAWLRLQSTRDLVYANTIDAFTALMKDEEVADATWYGHTAKHLIENSGDASIQRSVINIIEGPSAKIKSPKYYRLQREKAAL
jgi:hypothetical protein